MLRGDTVASGCRDNRIKGGKNENRETREAAVKITLLRDDGGLN